MPALLPFGAVGGFCGLLRRCVDFRARFYGVLNGQRPIGRVARHPVPLVPHKPRCPKQAVHAGFVPARPECKQVAQRLVCFAVRRVPLYVAVPQLEELAPVARVHGLVYQVAVIQQNGNGRGLRALLRLLRSLHVPVQDGLQLLRAVFQLPANYHVARNGHVLVGAARYVRFQPLAVRARVPAVHVVRALVVIVARCQEEQAQPLP